MPETARTLRELLEAALQPTILDIEDQSDRHRGHAGWQEGGGTHFRIRVVSARFAGLSRIARHRLVHRILAVPLARSIHALSIDARVPDEQA